ncbi:nuclear pore complex protein GP210 [Senna tora]|uniref:Nuclear pore complex protein GP210 n=1 Tax=Senna tora TaxID=362788 RepID=A0A834SDS0_9FABA|nr:nuclear pore complex protein GP210 [Senna tora]
MSTSIDEVEQWVEVWDEKKYLKVALGNPFYEAYDAVPFYAETNYPDVVCINTSNDVKGKIHLKAIRHGKALMRISISTAPQKSYFMMVRVGAHIHPQNPVLHIGGSLNFTIEGLDDKFSGQWFTTNGSVISLDMLSGMAEALGEGSAQGLRVEMDISYKPVETASYMSIMNVIGWTIMVGISMLFMYKICVLMLKEMRSWQSTVPVISSNAAPSTPI